MISKNKIKYIRSLELKKNRNKEAKFVAEGFKVQHRSFQLIVAVIGKLEQQRGKAEAHSRSGPV